MKSEVQGTVGGSREGLTLVGAERHSRFDRGSPRRSSLHITQKHRRANDPEPIMISDNDLYRLAIFLGSAAMVLIIFYHYVEVNNEEEKPEKAVRPAKSAKAAS
ncbi:oligosaccaryltransferase [Colletotrichum abscissum]|uniref:Dolichyl-diphosphooligosaccharide--protein glycosyltransferase subunit 4 n=1 Tax=Colletotrichum abscissum TaxID=1671311 RepID=A0A9Q0B371_9PEZI|nr:oligosaccaryltransferase [Colletotrichum abscissum]